MQPPDEAGNGHGRRPSTIPKGYYVHIPDTLLAEVGLPHGHPLGPAERVSFRVVKFCAPNGDHETVLLPEPADHVQVPPVWGIEAAPVDRQGVFGGQSSSGTIRMCSLIESSSFREPPSPSFLSRWSRTLEPGSTTPRNPSLP